jgi:hypothetical protein
MWRFTETCTKENLSRSSWRTCSSKQTKHILWRNRLTSIWVGTWQITFTNFTTNTKKQSWKRIAVAWVNPLRDSMQGNSSVRNCHATHQLKALIWVPTVGIIPWLVTLPREDGFRSTWLQRSCGWKHWKFHSVAISHSLATRPTIAQPPVCVCARATWAR